MSMTYDSSFLYDRSGYAYEGQLAGVPGLPNVGVFIAFSDSPYVANPGWTEVTQYVRTIPNIRRSRSDDWSTFSGSATVVLSNRDQRFNPFNTASPYNGLLKPRRQIKIVANANGVEYPVFRGYIAGWPVEWLNNDEDSIVSIECFDALSLLTDESTPQDLSDPYIASLNPVYYLPFSDPIDPNATVNPIKSAGSSNLSITYDPAIFRFINSGRLGDGMAPSAVNITSASSAFGVISGSASPRPPTSIMTMMGWWTTSGTGAITSGSPPIEAYNVVGAFRFTDLNVSFTWVEFPRELRVLIRLVTSPSSYNYKFYKVPLFLDPTTPHHFAIVANADGTLASLYSDGQALSTSLFVNSVESGSLDSLPDFFSFQGERQSWSAFNYALSADQIKQAYALGAGRVQESTTARFNRLLSTTRFPTALTSPPASPQGTVSEIKAGGSATVNELNTVRNSEGGELYVSKDGVVVMTERNSQLKGRSATTQAYFKDDGSAMKYAGNFTIRFDADSVVNDLRYSVTGGLDVNASDSNSQSAYGKQSYSVDTYLSTVSDAQSLANSRLAIFDTPVPQVSPLEVGITRSLSQWQTLLSLELLDQIEVTRTPSVGSAFSDRLLINEISHSITPEDWSMSIVGSARYSEWFTIDVDFIDGDRLIA